MFKTAWFTEIAADLEGIGAPSNEQVALIRRCVAFIDRRIPEDPPLWEACRHAESCWRAERGQRPRPMSARMPYVGPDYPKHRIAVVAINSRDSGHAGAEVRATAQAIASLRVGRREYGHGSFFHYRVACAVHAALGSLNDEPVDQEPAPRVAAESLLASARLQAVQCSPGSTSRRTPTQAMVRNCPEFLLRGQLEILAPRVLLLVGGAAHRAIESPPLAVDWEITWQASGRSFSRGKTLLAGREMTVLAFRHPSYTGWSRSWQAYLASVQANPLTISR